MPISTFRAGDSKIQVAGGIVRYMRPDQLGFGDVNEFGYEKCKLRRGAFGQSICSTGTGGFSYFF